MLSLKTTIQLGTIKSASLRRQGIDLPVRADTKGRLALVTGDRLARNVIATAIGDGSNTNPFRQDRTLGAGMLFSPNDPQVQASILARLYAAFEEFEVQRRYRLMTDTIEWESEGEVLILTFRYHDLEADASFDFTHSFGPAGSD